MNEPGGGALARPGPVLQLEDYLLLAAVLSLPWAFGGVVIWGYRTAALLLVSAAAVSVMRDGPRGLGLDRRARWLLPAALLGLWAGLQLVPLPPAVIGTISPAADALYLDTFPAYGGDESDDPVAALEARALREVPEVDGLPEPRRGAPVVRELGGRWSAWRSLSLAPAVGVERLSWYVALLAGFLVARRRCSDPDVAHLYGSAIVMLFAALGLFGLIYAATSNGKLYWVFLSAPQFTPAGPYVNPNHFAGAMELGTPWLLGWAGQRLLRRPGGRANPPTPLLIAGAVLCGLAGLVTGSRSFPLLLVFSVAVLAWLATKTLRQRLLALAVLLVLGAGMLLLWNAAIRPPGGANVVDALPTASSETSRITIWRNGLAVLSDYPVSGTGFGSVGEVIPYYRPAGAKSRLEQLHNDYLELFVEGGVIAGIPLLWLIVGWARRTFRPRALLSEGRVDLEAAGLLVGLVALSMHAFWAFNHQIHANALLFVTMAAIAVSRGERSTEDAGDGA